MSEETTLFQGRVVGLLSLVELAACRLRIRSRSRRAGAGAGLGFRISDTVLLRSSDTVLVRLRSSDTVLLRDSSKGRLEEPSSRSGSLFVTLSSAVIVFLKSKKIIITYKG